MPFFVQSHSGYSVDDCVNIIDKRSKFVQICTMYNWDDLRYFLAVARAQTVTGAATFLGVNHSTVSRRISSLEDAVGVLLFDRTKEGYDLTEAGLALLDHASKVERSTKKAFAAIEAQDHTLAGRLTVSAPQALAVMVLLPMLKSFRTVQPDIEVRLVSSDQLANLSLAEADIAIRR